MNMENLKTEIINILNEKKLTKAELRKVLNIKGEKQQISFNKALEELMLEEQIYLNAKGFYNMFDSSKSLIKGNIYIDKGGKGHFIGKKDGQKIKFLVNEKYLNGALNGDLVLIKERGLKRTYDLKLGEVDHILKRSEEPKIFIYQGGGVFTPYEEKVDIYLKLFKEECTGMVPGTLVLAWPSEVPIARNIYDGDIFKICGHIDDPKSIIIAIAKKQGFDNEFCEASLSEVEKIPNAVFKEDIAGRVDLRDEKIFTIDGFDTKDIDDAIGIKKDGDNYILRVCLADVAHYIKKGSVLDKEAYERGNSVYPVDMVLPMFPHIISNGICSLNPNVDRLAIVGEITLDKDFNVVNFDLYEGVIHSKKQMNYDSVNKVLNGDIVKGYEDFEEELLLLNKVAKKLEKDRKQNGALNFYSLEFKIMTDNDGNPTTIKKTPRGDGERLIENLMILMNTETANLLDSWGYQIAYRVHPEPQIERLIVIFESLKEQGIENDNIDKVLGELNKCLKGKQLNSKSIQMFLNSIKNEEYYETVSNQVLRSMKRACYQSDNIGHFGLSLDNYIHFTSPIRRYADLINHRIAKEIISYNYDPTVENYNRILEELEKIEKTLPDICAHLSEMEFRADKVEEEVDEIKKIEYFEDNLEDFEGPVKAKILNITKSGILAKVDNVFEIMIPAENLALSNFKYKKESRSFQNKYENISLGDEIYVFNPEVFKERRLVTYTDVSKDPNNLVKEIKRDKIKTIKLFDS